MLITLARTKQLVKPVLPTRDTAVCVLLDSRVRTVEMVRAVQLLPNFFLSYHNLLLRIARTGTRLTERFLET